MGFLKRNIFYWVNILLREYFLCFLELKRGEIYYFIMIRAYSSHFL